MRFYSKVVPFLIVFSMLLAACAPAVATQAPAVATEAPVATEVKTEAPAAPATEAATEAPAEVDYLAVFKDVNSKLGKDAGYGVISAQDLNNALVEKPPFLVDVREPSELEKNGYIDGAINIPVRDLLENLDKLPGLDEPIVIYCASGHRGTIALSVLTALGYTNVKNLAGGTGAWAKAEFPLEAGVPAAAEAISTPIVADAALFEGLNDFMKNLPEGFYNTNAAGFNEKLIENADMKILDLRSAAEVEKNGYIEGSENIPYEEILDKLPEDKTAPLAIYCGSGQRSGMTLPALKLLGYENVINLGGGLNAWKAAELPVAGAVEAKPLDLLAVFKDVNQKLGKDNGYGVISAQDLNNALVEKPPFLVDVREAAEIEKNGYIDGAIHIPVRDLLDNLDKLPGLDEPIVIYCASGHRGTIALSVLTALGYTNVKNLAGGTGAWAKAELPLEKGTLGAPEAISKPIVADQVLFTTLNDFMKNLPDGFYNANAAGFNELLIANPDIKILDLRSAAEVEKNGKIEGSENIPYEEILDKLPEDKDAPLAIYCGSGQRSGMTLPALVLLGYTKVTNLGGGLNAWVAAEMPVAK